jgi:hypothetical protein
LKHQKKAALTAIDVLQLIGNQCVVTEEAVRAAWTAVKRLT